MPFNDIADPKELAVLDAVLNDVCLAAGIKLQSRESEDAAGLPQVGCHTARDLKVMLEELTRQGSCA